MRTLDSMMLFVALHTKALARDLFYEEDGAVDIVAIVVLIGIAVLLAITFKEEINKLLKETLFPAISTQAEQAVTGGE